MAAKWTFMVYMAGFNNLSQFAEIDLAEMRRVGSTEEVKIAVFEKRLGKKTARHLIVGKDGKGEIREKVGDVDSGDPKTVVDFVRWAADKAPAEQYALVLWNHGGGWRPADLDDLYDQARRQRGDIPDITGRELSTFSNRQIARALFATSVEKAITKPTHQLREILIDDGTGHSLDTLELDDVLGKAMGYLEKEKLNLLGMDACLMSSLEVTYQVRDHVSHVVGSEDLEPGDGWPYTDILSRLSANPDMNEQDLGQTVVDCYIDSYRDRESEWPVTQCALDAGGLDRFVASFNSLAAELQGAIGSELGRARVIDAHGNSVVFMGDLYDIKSFCQNLKEGQSEQSVKYVAQKVLDELEPGRLVVAEGHLGDEVESCGGVTAYFPSPVDYMSPYYADLELSERTSWDEFLEAYRPASRRGRTALAVR